MKARLAEVRDLQARLERDRRSIERVRQNQRFWWLAVFLLGVGAGFLLAELLIDPVTIIVPSGGIEA